MAMENILDMGGWWQSAVFLHGLITPRRLIPFGLAGILNIVFPNIKTPFQWPLWAFQFLGNNN